MKYLIVCSSSGGHIYPALNFGNYLEKCNQTVKFLGIKSQIEESIIPSDKLICCHIAKSFRLAIKKPFKFIKELSLLDNIVDNYDVVIGFGGFITFCVSKTKCIKKKMFYLHEANVDIGDSNLYSLSACRRMFTSFKVTDNRKYRDKLLYVGNPVVDEIKVLNRKKEYISFIFGSLGSKTLLDIVSSYLLSKKDDNKYLLVTSSKYFDEYNEKLKGVKNVRIESFVDKNELYSQSKLIFCRGGASTLSEVMKASVNCVCIPSPYVKHNHQYRNAYLLFIHHALTLIEEKNFNSEVISELINLYNGEFGKMELVNQKGFVSEYPCIKMFMAISNDISKK